jgi:hypothetical protein
MLPMSDKRGPAMIEIMFYLVFAVLCAIAFLGWWLSPPIITLTHPI